MTQPQGALARLAGPDVMARLIPALGAALTVVLIGAPLAMLIYAALRGPSDFLPFEDGAHYTLDNLRGLISDPALVTRILPDTLVFVAGTVALTTVIAFALAWLTERTELPGRNVWFTLIVAPLLVPVPVIAIAWIMLFGPNAGWANQLLRALGGMSGEGPLNVFSMGGLIACQSIVSAPFVFLQISAALRGMSPVLEEAAAMAGAGALTTFRRITLPVLTPGLLAPIILVTLVTFEQFELPLIIGLPAKVMMSFSMVVFVFVLNVLEGVRSLDRDPIDLMRTMGASDRYIVRRVLLPAVLTWIMASFRISVGLALIGALVGELIGSSRGLGWYIERSAGQLDTTGVFTGIVILIAIAMVANNIVALVSNRLTRWRA